MSSVINRTLALGIFLLLIATSAKAHEPHKLSSSFQLCVKPIPGVRYDVSTGIDADVIHAHGRHGKVMIYVGRHPMIPRGMHIKPDITRRVPKELGSDLIFIAQSPHNDGHGLVSLYGYDREPDVQDQILILVDASDGNGNTALLRKVGDALIRCGHRSGVAKRGQIHFRAVAK